MDKTTFAGLTRLDPSDPLSTDGYSFQAVNPTIIDLLLRVAVQLHRHDGHAAMASPIIDPVVAVDTVGGTIPADTSITVAYTLIDADGGETVVNTTPQVITTQPGLVTPTDAPTAILDTSAGTLLAGSYSYALTITDGAGGETDLGPAVTIIVPAGPATNQIELSGLTAILTATTGTGWRLWRSVNGGQWSLINDGATDTITDDGSLCADRGVDPPSSPTGTTNATNQLDVTVPIGQPAEAVTFRIYASTDGSFSSPALLGEYPVADLGTVKTYPELSLLDGSPPARSLAVPGASQINALTDIANLHWRGPVADAAALAALTGNTNGDVVLQLSDMTLHGYAAGAWVGVGGGGGGGGAVDISALDPASATGFLGWKSADTNHLASIKRGWAQGAGAVSGVDDFSSNLLAVPGVYDFVSGAAELTVAGGVLSVTGVTTPKEATGPGFGSGYGDFLMTLKVNDADAPNLGEVEIGVRGSNGSTILMREGSGLSGFYLSCIDAGGTDRTAALSANVGGAVDPPAGTFWMAVRRVGTVVTAERWLVDPRGGAGAADRVETVDVSTLAQTDFIPPNTGAFALWFKLTPTTTGAATFDDLALTGSAAIDAIVLSITDLTTGVSANRVLLDVTGNTGIVDATPWATGTLQGAWVNSVVAPEARLDLVNGKYRVTLRGGVSGGASGPAWQLPLFYDGNLTPTQIKQQTYRYGTATITISGRMISVDPGTETDVTFDGITYWLD